MELLKIWAMAILAMVEGNHCDIGTKVDNWYDYYDNHIILEEYSTEFDDDNHIVNTIGYFKMSNGDNVLFFYNPQDMPHGYCAVILDR